MSIDIPAPPSYEAMDPMTAEIVDVSPETPTDRLAELIYNIRDFEAKLREAKTIAGDELLRRLDADATTTAHVGGWKIEGDPATRYEYDALLLYALLSELVDEGAITTRARDKAVERSYTFKAKLAGINALVRLGGPCADAVAKARHEVRKPRRIKGVARERLNA